ncbi:Uncharacterized protein APZ42_026903 [Daphnia magna]|uniref:Uncharacterized protein n=1 Tax=Daphnia magna TaxID=35525 RepID=A0A164RVV9_9CRUS|nr:Uncharacterized protein APZ42_026903 [Daphnia magna]
MYIKKPMRRYCHIPLPNIRNGRRRILLVFIPWQISTWKPSKWLNLFLLFTYSKYM